MPKIEKKEIELEKKVSKSVKKDAKSSGESKKTGKAGIEKNRKTKTTLSKTIKNEEKKNFATVNKNSSKKTASKKVSTKRELVKKETRKKNFSKILEKENKKNVSDKDKKFLQEYYDLPYRYNETVVKILAQTPKRLFVYWDISDKDIQKYINAFGEDFFDKTYPVLLIHNEELNYTFEVPVNDFANSWYLDITDSKSKYVVQLGRKFKKIENIKINEEVIREENINLQNDYLYITDSNKLEAPNDHILFEKLLNHVIYRNLKDGSEFNKEISNIIDKLGQIYPSQNLRDVYKALYGDEFDSENEFEALNPGSNSLSSSGFRK